MAFYDTPGLLYDSGVLYDGALAPQLKRNRMAKVKLNLQNLTPDETVALANLIKTAMTGNANFTTPNPSLATIGTGITTAQTKIATYNTAVAAQATALGDRDNAILSLRGLLTQEAAYVENITNGDRVKIESAGMSVRADASPIGPMPQVLNLVVTADDNDGALDAAWDPVRGAGSYEVQVSVDPVSPTSWAFKEVSNKSTVVLNNFTSGAKMWARVRAIGADNNKGPWSDPAVKTVP